MKYNLNYINLKYTLISCFLFRADKNVLDISYCIIERTITIQVVLVEGFTLSKATIKNIDEQLPSFEIRITEIYLTKEQFNSNRGEWQPKDFKWLDRLLFSKAEVL